MEDSSTGTDRALRKSSDLALKDHDEVDFLRKKLEEASAEKENLNQILQSVAREVRLNPLLSMRFHSLRLGGDASASSRPRTGIFRDTSTRARRTCCRT